MLILVLILAYFAGHLTVAALRPHDEPWQGIDLFWSALTGVALTGWLGQALADLGIFHGFLLAGILAAYSAVLALRVRSRIVPRGLHGNWREIGLLGGVLVVAAALFFQPADTAIGGRDDGIRVMAGAAVARQGGWLQTLPLLPDLPLYRGAEGDLKHLGFLILDAERSLVVPQFTGVHEVWQAIAWGVIDPDLVQAGGVRAAHPLNFYLNPLFALFALLACYVLGRSLFGRAGAIVGTLLLAINVAQVWYARQTMGEILLQALLLGGTAASMAYLRAPGRVTALATGISFGVALLTKVDALIALGVLGGVLLLVWPQRRAWPYLRWLVIPLLLAIAHYVAHSALFSANYLSDNFGNLLIDPVPLMIVALGAGVIGGLIALRARFRERVDALMTRPLPSRWRLVGFGLLLLLIGYAYFVRPTMLAQESYIHSVWNQRFFTYRGLNLVMLVAYLTPISFALALCGLARLITRHLRWHHFPFLGMVFGYGVVFTYNAMIVGDQPFWVRRFLPVVIPGALLLAGAGIAALWAARNPWRWAAPVLLLVALGWSGRQTAPIAALRSGAGLSPQVAAFAAKIPPNAVVLFQDWQAGFDLAAPLEILYGRESYALTGEFVRGVAAQQWRDQLMQWQQAGRPLIYVAANNDLTLTSDELQWQPLDPFTLRYSTIETTHDRLPQGSIDVAKPLNLYGIVPAPNDQQACTTTIEVGGNDYGAIGPGFYESEATGEQVARWTEATASLVIPTLAENTILTVTMYDGRPASAGAADVQLSSTGTPIATLTLQPGWHEYSVQLPAALAAQPAPILIDLSVPTWTPQQFGQPDGRALGVMIDKFTLQRAACTP